ncbi:MAG TPA: IS3 family transposase [Gemmatimonadaceae bacterium]|jgi:transposase InsO family protein
MTTICETLGIGRATAYRPLTARARHYAKAADRVVAAQITTVVRERASYGYRRVTAVVNRSFATTYNRKRIRRVMAINAWLLPRAAKRRSTRPHRGSVERPRVNERWSSDAMQITCWNGEVVDAAFALDCCDRECLAWVASAQALTGADIRGLITDAVRGRFGDARPPQPIQWLSDNGSMYTALETVIAAERAGLTPITTPVCSPESNGISEAFHHTLRRDYLAGADLSCAALVLEQLPQWITDYNHFAPHSALGMRSPLEYRRTLEIASD